MNSYKLLVIILLLSLTVSCNSDDDAPQPQDPLIGEWTLSQRFQNDVEINLGDCFINDAVTFIADGMLESIFHRVTLEDECIFSHDATGTWENLGNNKYFMTEGEEGIYNCEINDAGNVFTLEFTWDFLGETIEQKDILVKKQ
ncbi:lipocalin family protein [Abyssalbus ytuae]|uniref:Lipocalin family protein n=1 Tax=Abyssalbus ytuae TaxID=2926907 RepID=A0A9E6ZP43_9FLAO|nr:lipocalin family protein [Abyssalbus ytuae]UOB17940.1 lipocalin family protein [Abyssalbus ytuae]